MKYRRHLFSLALLLVVTVWPSPTRAETIDCIAITSIPYVITTQGIYCLTGNLSTGMMSGSAITIATNNVTLDLNGYKLGGLGAGDSTGAIGIRADLRKNITIKNGIVRGFAYGIWLDGDFPYTTSSGHVVKDILADQNTYTAIAVYGLGNTISNNTIVDTGGSTLFNNAFGIEVRGSGAKIVNNEVSKTIAQSTSISGGIYLNYTDYSLVQNSTVTDTTSPSGTSYGIYISSAAGVFVRNNNLANTDNGLYFSGSGSGKYFNNLTFDVTTPFTGGTPIGSNNN